MSSLCQIELRAPAARELAVMDWLFLRFPPDALTIAPVEIPVDPNRRSGMRAQVLGREPWSRICLVIAESAVAGLIDDLSKAFPNSGIRYQITVLLEYGCF